MPPVSDGSGFDRTLLKQAYELLLAAGCKRDGEVLTLPNGKPLTDRVPRFQQRPAAAYDALHPESRQARHPGEHAHRRRGAIQEPHRGLRLRRRHPGDGRLDDAGRRSARRVHFEPPRRRTARAISPASPIRSSTRWSRRSPRPSRGRNSMRPAARSTACCAQGIIGCRCGIATPLGWPIGTRSRGPSGSRSSAPARPAPGGGTKGRRRRLDCDGTRGLSLDAVASRQRAS